MYIAQVKRLSKLKKDREHKQIQKEQRERVRKKHHEVAQIDYFKFKFVLIFVDFRYVLA